MVSCAHRRAGLRPGRSASSANWHPFIPPNTGEFGSRPRSGILRGASIVFFAYIGFDAVSTALWRRDGR
jgi:amino acid transporter